MNFFKVLIDSFYDLLRNNYAYHSGALTYQFLLAIAPLSIVLFNLLSLMPFIDTERIVEFVDNFLPQYTNKVIHEIITLQSHGKQASVIAVVLSYFFSVGFVKNLSKAFAFVSENTLGQKHELVYWITMPILLLVLVLILALFFFINLVIKMIVPLNYSFVIALTYISLGTLVLIFIYITFLNKRIKVKHLLISSFISSLLIFIAQTLFTWYVANIFRGSLLYGSLSTLVAFLIWSNLNFLVIIFGARLIYRLENP